MGEPSILKEGNVASYRLWYDANGWHLRCDSYRKVFAFSGTIGIVGGKVTEVTGFESLETSKKKKKSDLGVVSEAKDQISFKFKTKKDSDGFDFQVDDAAKEISFKLQVDGKPAYQRVLIGPSGQPATSEVFVLPAHPKQ